MQAWNTSQQIHIFYPLLWRNPFSFSKFVKVHPLIEVLTIRTRSPWKEEVINCYFTFDTASYHAFKCYLSKTWYYSVISLEGSLWLWTLKTNQYCRKEKLTGKFKELNNWNKQQAHPLWNAKWHFSLHYSRTFAWYTTYILYVFNL